MRRNTTAFEGQSFLCACCQQRVHQPSSLPVSRIFVPTRPEPANSQQSAEWLPMQVLAQPTVAGPLQRGAAGPPPLQGGRLRQCLQGALFTLMLAAATVSNPHVLSKRRCSSPKKPNCGQLLNTLNGNQARGMHDIDPATTTASLLVIPHPTPSPLSELLCLYARSSTRCRSSTPGRLRALLRCTTTLPLPPDALRSIP